MINVCVAAHFDYDPEWTNERRVFEIQPIKMIVVKMRSNTGQFFGVLLRILTTIFLIGWISANQLRHFQNPPKGKGTWVRG